MANYNINEELERAVEEQKLEEVKALLSAGADVNHRVKYHYQNTLLHFTTSVEITKELLLRGAQVNPRDRNGETPLHAAMTRGGGSGKKLEIVRELLKHGADVNAETRKGNTALNCAVKKSNRNLEVIKELLEHGADINRKNCERRFFDNHHSSLDNAIGDLACAKLLIKYTLIRNFNKDYQKIIDLSSYKNCRNYSELSSYLDDCICEIVQMKTDEIKGGLTLYEILTKHFNKHVLCNNQLSLKLTKIDFSVRYPIYNDLISDKIKPFLEKADLLNKLSKLQFYTQLDMMNQGVQSKKVILDYDSTYNVSEYLPNNDLLNLIAAFDEPKKHTNQALSSSSNPVEASTSNDAKRIRLE